jgi:hypothetical protein
MVPDYLRIKLTGLSMNTKSSALLTIPQQAGPI